MFRRPGKNPLEEDASLYNDENHHSSAYSKYSAQNEQSERPPRLFDTPHQPSPPMHYEEREEVWSPEKTTPLPHHFEGMVKGEDPETTLGEGVSFRGELTFERLLKIDGTFEGELLSQGKVVVGPSGKVRANLNLREAIIEGVVEGNVIVQERLELRGEAVVKGDITAQSLSVDEGVHISGHVHVVPNEEASPSEI